jgi:uncharacterized protein (DUF924 family)
MTHLAENWAADVLSFWFEEATPEQWFKKDEAFDQRLRDRFLTLHEQVAALPADACLANKDTALAAVIVCDQLPRNMFRGASRAFATDAKALGLAEATLERGWEAGMTDNQRLFLYLPFEHAEDVAAQARCVALMSTLADADLVRWARAHQAVIQRFGRFPHRTSSWVALRRRRNSSSSVSRAARFETRLELGAAGYQRMSRLT